MKNLAKFFKNKRILITGHTGFKGSWLSQILLNWGAQVSGLSLKPESKPNLFDALGLKKKISNHFVDIRDYKKVKAVLNKEKPEIVFHLAAQALVRESFDNSLYTFETNTLGTVNVLEAIKETSSVRAAVIVTTDKVYQNNESGIAFKETDPLAGHDPYSASKAAAEIIIDSYIKSFFNGQGSQKHHKTLIASARAGNVIGGGDWSAERLVPDIIRGVYNNEKIIIRNPDSIRPWQFVLEPLYGYLLLAQKLFKGQREFSGAWNFGPNKNNLLTVKNLTESALKILEKGSYVVRRDSSHKHEAGILKLNCNKALNNLSWRPALDIKDTLALTFDWYKSFYNQENMLNITNQQIEVFLKKL